MSNQETTIQKKMQELVEDRGGWVVKFHGSPFTKKGTPDLLICYRGRFIAIEAKVPGKEDNTTKLQDYQIEQIREAGGFAFIMSSEDDLKELLDSIDRVLNKQNKVDKLEK
jgi:Holliday junction resolvase